MTFNKSSKKPTKARGIRNKGANHLIIRKPNKPTITNEIPPPLGVGLTCELRLLGISTKYLLRKGLINFKKK